MNILLVYPSRLDSCGRLVKYRQAFLPPLALAILTALTPPPHAVRVVNDLVEEIDFAADVDLVGISIMTSQAERGYRIADRFRKRGVKVVIGGIHASCRPEEARRHASAVVIGEAETTWPKVLVDAETGRLQPYYQADGWADLSRSPGPDFSKFRLDVYASTPFSRFPIMMPVFTTRGCPYGCRFCSVTRFFGSRYRTKPVAQVVAEILSIGAPEYFFVDDNLTCQPEYARELFAALEGLKREGKGIRFFSQVSTRILLHPDLIDRAARAGCSGLFIGIESIEERNLSAMGKTFNRVVDYEELFSRLQGAGISPHPSIIFGFDSDTPAQFGRTFDFLVRTRVGGASFWLLTPLPGTDLFEEMERDGRLLEGQRWSSYDMDHVVFRPRNFTPDDLYQRFWAHCRRFHSWKNTLRRIGFKVAMSRNPLKTAVNQAILGYRFRLAILAGDNPFSCGFGRYLADGEGGQSKSAGLLTETPGRFRTWV